MVSFKYQYDSLVRPHKWKDPINGTPINGIDLFLSEKVAHRLFPFFQAVNFSNLIVQRPEVIQIPQAKDPECQQIDNPCEPFAHIHPVRAKKTQKRQKDPRKGVIDPTRAKPQIRLPIQ